MKRVFIFLVRVVLEVLTLPFILATACLSRMLPRAVDIGLGPEPLINNIYHKKALLRRGYTVETFVTSIYFITQEFDWKFVYNSKVIRLFVPFAVFCFAVLRYRCIYMYFNGGAFFGSVFLWRLEPQLFRVAGVRTVIMPYGGDIQCLERCPNLLFRHAMSRDYPGYKFRQAEIKERIDLWTKHADHVIAGNDWVDYLYYWDTLMLNHFSIDMEEWCMGSADVEVPTLSIDRPLRVLHAPNHRELKGTRYFIKAIEELCREGVPIELMLVEKLHNDQLRNLMKSVDIVADQLIIGWYAMFAIEAMSLGKPVLCFIRDDLKRLYVDVGLISENEIPVINCSPSTVKAALRQLAVNRQELSGIARRGRAFVEKHHSLNAIGSTFDLINRSLGVMPSGSASC